MKDVELYPYQKEGIEKLLKRRRFGLCDEMGLGKTRQILGVIDRLRPRTVIVVCPASVIPAWRQEISKTITGYQVLTPRTRVEAQKEAFKHDQREESVIYVLSFEIISKTLVAFRTVPLDVLIVDEFHFCKNHLAQRTEAVISLAKTAGRVYALTGTPMPNRPREVYTLCNLVQPRAFPFFHTFALRYCGAYDDGFGWNYDGASNLEELNDILKKHIFLRRTKEEVALELPPKLHHTVFVQPKKKDIAQESCGFIKFLQENFEEAVEDKHLATIRRELGISKTDGAVSWIKDRLQAEDKLVVFCYHREVYDHLICKLNYKLGKENVFGINGVTRQEQRASAVSNFQNSKNPCVFVGQIQAAGTGITLTAAKTAVFVEADWCPANMAQAADRIHRIGQKFPCEIIHLCAENSLDEAMARILINKMQTIKEAIG